MADIWKEAYNPNRKGSLSAYHGANETWEFPQRTASAHSLSAREIWFVRVCSFTFVFHTLAQVEACLDFYNKKVHPSSRIPGDRLPNYGGDHRERQRWFERLPTYLLEEPKRKKVVAALRAAVREWTKEQRTSTPMGPRQQIRVPPVEVFQASRPIPKRSRELRRPSPNDRTSPG
jgi:hypothetical protein